MLDTFSKATLDVIAEITLGFKSTKSFHDCYDRIFNQSLLSSAITSINTWVSVRKWLPIEANMGFVSAQAEIERRLREQIRKKVNERLVGDGKKSQSTLPNSQDILSYIIEERAGSWTEDDILGYVSALFRKSFHHHYLHISSFLISCQQATRLQRLR